MFIDAMKEKAQFDMLFYVGNGVADASLAAVARWEDGLSQHWNAQVNLVLCPTRVEHSRPSNWSTYGPGALSFVRQSTYFRTGGRQQVKAFEDCLRRQPDAIFVHRLDAMCPVLLSQQKLPPVLFDLDDIEHVAFARRIKQPPTWRSKRLYYLHLPALFWGEYRAVRLARQTFVCSNPDRDYLARVMRLPGITTIPNAMTIPALQPLTEAPTLLFLGTYAYEPNVAAAEFLLEHIWPRVHRSMPAARLIIAGDYPHNIRLYKANIPGVEFTGFVEKLDALYQRTRVVCCPIQAGSGTRVKIIEAAAFGKPIVSTSMGAEGLELSNNQEIFLRNDPQDFAETCLGLLNNMPLCTRLGASARAAAIKFYDRRNVVGLIQNHLQQALCEPSYSGVEPA
jgi:glycosyltransferase involved in cell wall biosynthesis